MTSDTPQDPELTPAAEFVLHVLQEEGPLTRQELHERLPLRRRTIDRSVKALQNGDYLLKTRENGDLRQVVYHIGKEAEV